jgi:hypothetical protein
MDVWSRDFGFRLSQVRLWLASRNSMRNQHTTYFFKSHLGQGSPRSQQAPKWTPTRSTSQLHSRQCLHWNALLPPKWSWLTAWLDSRNQSRSQAQWEIDLQETGQIRDNSSHSTTTSQTTHRQVQLTWSLPNNSLGRYHIRWQWLEECKIVLWLPFQGPTVPAVQVRPQLDSDVAPTSYSRQQYWSTMLCMDASRKISIMFSDAPVIKEVNPAARPANSS